MILRRFFTLAVLAVAVSLSFSGRAQASYDTSVSVFSVTPVGGSFLVGVTQSSATSFSNSSIAGGAAQSTPNGYATFVDQAGSTIYLVNQVLTGLIGSSAVNESLFVATPSTVSDNSTWTVNLQVSVVNPTQTPPGVFFGGGTTAAAIAETQTYVLNSQAAGQGNYTPVPLPPTLAPPTTIIVGSSAFLLNGASAVGGNVNSSTNNGGIGANINPTAIPEPASVVLLGGGLAGVLVFGLRRRSKVA